MNGYTALLRVLAATCGALVATLLLAALAAQEVPDLQVNSTRYIVVDADTGNVYAQRNAEEKVAIASLTKVFTAVQAVNMAPLDTLITTKSSDLQSANATTMGFGPGETYTLRDLIYGMLLPSGNDAAYAIARALGHQEGDSDDEAVERFMALLNQRVENMGLDDTRLLNPDGWGVPGHYSTASDVAAFMQYAVQFPFLVEVMGTQSYTTSNGVLTVTNSNKLLNSYEPIVGGKTGYDDDAGWCLVNLAELDGTRMIAVTLDGVAPDDWYDDNRVLLDYGFQRKSEIAASDEAFSGEVIRYIDPDAAQLAMSGQQQTAIGGGPPSMSGLVPPEPTGDIRSSTNESMIMQRPRADAWMAFTAAISLVGMSGLLHWRDTGGSVGRTRVMPVDLTAAGS